MGVKYTVNLYIPVEQVETLLAETANISLRHDKTGKHSKRGKAYFFDAGQVPLASADEGYEKPLLVHLPSGRTAFLPFTSSFNTEPISVVAGEESAQIDTSLVFPIEGTQIHSVKSDGRFGVIDFDGQPSVEIGLIYLTVYVGKRYAAFYYRAATYSMSREFFEFEFIQNRFLELLKKANGVVALMDVEEDAYHLLGDMTRLVRINEWDFQFDSESVWRDFDIDGFVEAVKENLQQPYGIAL